jgi:hypothetical protein
MTCGLVKSLSRRDFLHYSKKSSDSELSIAQAYSEEGWRIPFRRSLDQNDLQAWRDLCNVVEEIDLANGPDSISWHLDPSGTYSTLELCKKPKVSLTKYLWDCSIPLKIKIFTWQLARGRLPSNDQILIRLGPSDGSCALCGDIEHVDHIFFSAH